MIAKFIKNLKEYIDYLMKVDFKDLFINTIILLCIILLAGMIYIPVGIVKDLVRSFLIIFADFGGVLSLIFNWIFNLIGYGLCILGFMFLFNKRFEDLEAFKDQVKGNGKIKVNVRNNDSKKDEVEYMELPKTKNS